MATMNDIAKAAGVSRGTVSNVLNGRSGVSYEKILMVEKAAASLGYSLDKRASTLRKGVSGSIALIIPDISEKKYSDLYMGVLESAGAADCRVFLYLSNDKPYREREMILEAMKEKVMGVLTVSCLEKKSEEYDAFLSQKIPVVFLERQGDDLCSYIFDMEKAAELVASAVSSSHAALLSDSLTFADQLALKDELKRLLFLEDDAVFENNHRELSSASYRLAEAYPRLEYCIAGSEQLGKLAENAFLRATGKRPVICCLASFSGLPENHFINIQLNYRLLGLSAAGALLSAIEEKKLPVSRTFAPSGICRGADALPQKEKERPSPAFWNPAILSRNCTLKILAHSTPAILALKTLIPQFTKRTGIRAEIVTTHLSELLTEAVSQHEKWDIVRLDPSSMSHMAPSIFCPLEDIDKEASAYFENFLPTIPQDYSRSGQTLYAFPFDISMQLLFYRKSLFESTAQQRAFYEETGRELKVPATYEELEQVAAFFTRSVRPDSPTPYGSSIAAHTSRTSLTTEYLPRLISAGGLSYTPSGMLNLKTTAAVSALEEYIRFSRYAYKANRDWGDVASSFVNGSYATTTLYLHYASSFVRTEEAVCNGDIGFAPMPGGNSLLAGGSLGVGKFSDHREEAYEFIKWAAGPEIAPALVMLGGISSSAVVYEQRDILASYPWLSYLAEHIKDGISRPLLSFRSFSHDQTEFEHQLKKNLLAALEGEKTPQEALADAQEYLTSLNA